MSFASLGLSDDIVRAVTEHGYTVPTPIQVQAIPAVLSGGDLLAGAQTGTGKTAGFTLPILQRLSTHRPTHPGAKAPIRALVLTPTRELAAQVEESVRTYGKHVKLSSMVMFGGVGMNPQLERLKRRVDILVATPGRLLDHAQQGSVDLGHVEILVLDEADRMLDMGFIHDIKKVLALLPKQRQNLLFSATFSDEIKALADRLLNAPALIEVARRNATADTVAQKVHLVDRERKRELLAHLIKAHDWHQVLVFTRTKHGANRLAEQLEKSGIPALAIHGNKSQNARTKALAEFKAGTLPVLVATDIAARGIDISELPHVVNFELPNVPEDYVHRIGRTGRAGAEGEAVSLVCVDEAKLLADIERLIKRPLPKEIVPGFEPDPSIKPEPIPNGRNRHLFVNERPAQGRSQPGARPPRADAARSGAPRGDGARPGGARSGNGARPASGNGARPAGGNGQRPAGGSGAGRGPQSGSGRSAQPRGEANGNVVRPTGGPRRAGAGGEANGNRAPAPRPADREPNGNR
ncbi:ATP-dependent RNA helicase RhlE [Plasticicumulans lactativorans]|uniref:ATP-dependent RNA helicase RhlE n=1 Tax=Plasticicumulans lactativorans TaxID=1133106 RepID=A0A4R2L5N4_9GAMM|nr:DEAD/DEAH box helicase [Plasticicumulans lactativorans]TCO81752.1 ATP-dependent RNA helicase RhlE [Plasticicumulans lactativorans]